MATVNKVYLAVLILSINILLTTNQDLITDSIVGVSVGDVFVYEMYGYFTSQDPNTTINVPAFEANNTEWVKIEITNVSNTTIYHTYTLNYFNRTQEVFKGQTALIGNSSINQDFRGVPICPTDLKIGDWLPTLPLKVNNTLKWNYPDGPREVNYVQWSTSDDIGSCYFDKKTGMLLDLNRTHLYTSPTTNQTIKKTDIIKMTQSDLWIIQQENLLPTLLIIAITTAIIVTYLVRKKIHTQN